MKTYEEVFTFENLYISYLKSRRGKRNNFSCNNFEINALEYTENLYDSIINDKYNIGKYREFKVYEPKERLIMALPFQDRVVQHCLCDFYLEELLEPKLIYDNCANRKDKGTHFGLNRLKLFMGEHYRKYNNKGYFLKMDISKYFYSINKEILKNMLSPYIKDKKLNKMINEIIDSTKGEVGIPIGNQSSQWFAIFYMSGLDHFIKEKLKIKHYVRYMDDMVIIHKDKEYLKFCLSEITNYLDTKLDLKLNNKTQIFPIKNGVDFLGFHLYITETGKVIKKLRRSSKSNMKRKMKRYKKMYKKGVITKENIKNSYNSWVAHASNGNNYHLIQHMNKYYNDIFL